MFKLKVLKVLGLKISSESMGRFLFDLYDCELDCCKVGTGWNQSHRALFPDIKENVTLTMQCICRKTLSIFQQQISLRTIM